MRVMEKRPVDIICGLSTAELVQESAPKRGLWSAFPQENNEPPTNPQPAIAVLQLRISLRGLSPLVWRRVLVPEHLTLAHLHNVVQVVMGWTDEYLHQFTIRGRRYGEAYEGVMQFSTVANALANALALTAFGLRQHEGFVYVYDFNAWWRHDIRVERRLLRQRPDRLHVAWRVAGLARQRTSAGGLCWYGGRGKRTPVRSCER